MVVGEFTQETQLLVIGGGPGGYAAAFRAAELGVQTAIVELRDGLGGECLNAGCIPSKSLLHVASVIRNTVAAERFGLSFEGRSLEPERLRECIRATIATLGKGLETQSKKYGIERLAGQAVFEDPKRVAIRGGQIPRAKFRRAIIATGSEPRAHSALTYDDRVWTPGQALGVPTLPARLLVVGSDYMAVELATVYAVLGSATVLACPEPHILMDADRDVIRPLERRLREDLEAVHTGTDVVSADLDGESIRVAWSNDLEPAAFDAVIVCAGRRGRTGELGLEHTGVALDVNGFVTIDESTRTADPRILAVGDVTGHPCLADIALAQGRVAAEVVAGQPSRLDVRAVPQVVYTDPDVAWCGLTEIIAKSESIAYKAIKIPWSASGLAVGKGRTDGMTKLLFDPESQIILGAAVCGEGAAEMIGTAALAIEMSAELTDLAETMHPHPTASELLADLARAAANPIGVEAPTS